MSELQICFERYPEGIHYFRPTGMTLRWHYWQGSGLAIHRLWVAEPLHSGFGQTTYTCVPLSPNSIIWYQPRGKVTTGFVTKSPVGWLPRNQDQLWPQCSMLSMELLYFFTLILN